MQKFLMTLVATIGLAGAVTADPIEGVWTTQPDDGAYAYVTISQCGNAFCGVISRTFNSSGEYQSENIGRQLVIDMAPQGGGEYRGSVWRPSNDKIYSGRINLDGNSMTLRGCLLGQVGCARQTWTRN